MMSSPDEAGYVATVRQAMAAINPSITEAAAAYGWPAALDAVSTILMSLLIAAVGPDGSAVSLWADVRGRGSIRARLGSAVGCGRGAVDGAAERSGLMAYGDLTTLADVKAWLQTGQSAFPRPTTHC